MPQRKMQAGHSSLPQRRIESDAEGRCGDGRSRRAILHRHYNYAASIRKSGPEIKNRCTKEGVNGEKLTSIPKFGPEIKNRCMQQAIFSTRSLDESLWRYVGGKLEVIVWTLVRQWRQKRVLMRPEAAFPYVFAAEGAQHPPIGRHAQRSPQRRNLYQKKSGPVFD